MQSLFINEIFSSLQGEGPWLGLPATFIRLAGCVEPFCPWCDTAYAWNQGERLSVDEILAEVRRLDCKNVVITGGEPFLQWSHGLETLHRALVVRGCLLQYETSGKVTVPVLPDALVVMSPKHLKGAWQLAPGNVVRADALKFVVEDDADEVAVFVEKYGVDKGKIWLMPRGATREEQMERMATCFDLCIQHGFRMSPRLHTLTYDNRRGK